MGNKKTGICGTVVASLVCSIILCFPAVQAQTYVEGDIIGAQVWDTGGSPYIAIGDVYVKDSLSIIGPNVDVKFNEGVSLFVEGELSASDVLFDHNETGLIPWQGIWFNGTSSNSRITNCNVSSSDVGIVIDGTPQPPILNDTTIHWTDIGLVVNGSDPTLVRLKVDSSTSYSVVANNSNLVLEDSTLVGATRDFHVSNTSHAKTLNTTFQGDVSVADLTSDLTVQNYLHILVLNETMGPIDSADIKVTDYPPSLPAQPIYTTSYFEGSDPGTNPLGKVGWIIVTDRVYTNTGETDNLTRIEVYYPGKTFGDNPRYVSMDSSHTETFIAMSTAEPPEVVAWDPTGGPVLVDAVITATFDKPMNRTSVEESLRYNDGDIVRNGDDGSFAWSTNETFTFTPNEQFACCTDYNVTLLSSTAKDKVGIYLDGDGDGTSGPDFSWNFTTERSLPPEVDTTRPFGGEMDVSISSNIIVTFDRPMNKSSVSAAFSYSNGTDIWNSGYGEMKWVSTNHISDTLIFNPFENLQTSMNYNVTINGSLAMDNCDAQLSGGVDYVWNFTTEPIDDDPPQIISHIPDFWETDVDASTVIQIHFTENMNIDSVNASFSYTDSSTTWDESDGNVTWNTGKDVFTFEPTMNLFYGTSYYVNIDASVATDAFGNPLDGNGDGVGGDDYAWTFTTEIVQDITPPTVLSHSPIGSQVSVEDNIVVLFSELMNENSVQSAFTYTDGATMWGEGDGVFDWNGPEMTFIPDFDFDYSTGYSVTVAQSAEDLAGNQLADDYGWTFTTKVGIGKIFGEVKDENGVALSGVKVSIPALDLETETASNGSYVFENVQAGEHVVRFSKEGFNRLSRDVTLEPEQELELSVTMSHSLTLLDLWWMILIIVILVVVLIILLVRRRKKAQEWPGADDVAYVEPPPEEPFEEPPS